MIREELTTYNGLTVGDRVTGPGPRPSAPRELGTLVELFRLHTARSSGVWARVEREDGTLYSTAVGLLLRPRSPKV